MDAQTNADHTLEAREPLIKAVARLYQFKWNQDDTLRAMDQLCRSPAGCAFAERILNHKLKPEIRQAFAMVSPRWGRRMFSHDNTQTLQGDRAEVYLDALRKALQLYPGLDAAARAVEPNHQQQIAQQLLAIWKELYADDPTHLLAIDAIKPVIHLLPERLSDQIAGLNIEAIKAQECAAQRQLIIRYMAGEGPFDIARVAPSISDPELRALAVHPKYASVAILTELEIRHDGPDVMIEAYLDALFAPGKGMHGQIPTWVYDNRREFLDRFMVRLEQQNAQGFVFGTDPMGDDTDLIKMLLGVAQPHEYVAFCLGSRMELRQSLGPDQQVCHPKYGDHPVEKARKLVYFDAGPGQWGPIIKQVLAYLKDKPILEEPGYLTVDQEAALSFLLALNDYHKIDERKPFLSSGLRKLTTKQYLDDLMFPIDAQSRVIDHIPTLMTYIDGLIGSIGREASENVEIQLRKQFASIERGFLQQEDRILKAQLKAQQPRPKRERAECITQDVL